MNVKALGDGSSEGTTHVDMLDVLLLEGKFQTSFQVALTPKK